MFDSLFSSLGYFLYEVIWVNVVLHFVKKTSWGKDFTAIRLWWTVFFSVILFIITIIVMLSMIDNRAYAFITTSIFWLVGTAIIGKVFRDWKRVK